MILIEIIDWIWSHRGEVTLNAILLLIVRKFVIREMRKLLHLGREGELKWVVQQVEKLTGEKYDGQPDFLRTVRIRYIGNSYSYLRKVIPHVYQQRRNQTMLTILKSSISKKLLAFLVAAGVTALNGKLGLNLNAETVYGVIGLAIAYIAGQSHVDAKKAISNAVNNAASAVIEASATTDGSAITTITAPPMTFEESMKMISQVHADINRIFADAKNKDNFAAMQNALNAYTTIHDYFTKSEGNP